MRKMRKLTPRQIERLGNSFEEYDILATCLYAAPLTDDSYLRYVELCNKAGIKPLSNG